MAGIQSSFGIWAEQLKERATYSYCKENAHRFAVDLEMVNICLRRYESLTRDVESHNSLYVDRIVEQNKDYFDTMLSDIDSNIKLDDEQRRAVVTDDVVAGAGAEKLQRWLLR